MAATPDRHDDNEDRKRRRVAWLSEDLIASALLLVVGTLSILALAVDRTAIREYAEAQRFAGVSVGLETAAFAGSGDYTNASAMLGMSPAAVRGFYPEARVARDSRGRSTARFSVGEARFEVSFLGEGGAASAFRVQYSRTLSAPSAAEYVDELATELGAEPRTRCAAAGSSCRHHWRLEDGTAIELLTESRETLAGDPLAPVTVTLVRSTAAR